MDTEKLPIRQRNDYVTVDLLCRVLTGVVVGLTGLGAYTLGSHTQSTHHGAVTREVLDLKMETITHQLDSILERVKDLQQHHKGGSGQ